MKENFTVLLLSSLTFLVSCVEHEDQAPAIRRIINETGFQVRFEVFGDESNKLIYSIEPQDSITIEGFCNSNVVEYCFLGWRGNLAFGKIFFDDDRVLSFELPRDRRNDNAINGDPLGGNGYVRTEENGIQIYTYRITTEDYDDAELVE